MVFKQLSRRLEEDNPIQFKLPQEVRQFFTGGECTSLDQAIFVLTGIVATGARGDYVDAEEARTKYEYVNIASLSDLD